MNNIHYRVGGCLPQPKDKRDWKFGKYIKPLKSIYIPPNYESEIPNDFIYDQKDSSECCACAYSTIRMVQEYEQSRLNEPLSPSFTYANRKLGHDYEGMTLSECCKQGREGSILWSEFPDFYTYKEARKIFEKNKQTFLEHAYPFRINSFYTAHTDLEMMQAIYLTKAILIGINVTEPFYYPNELGYINYSYDDKRESNFGHALCVIGWKTINNEKYWIIVNSWGKQWGDNGKCYIKFSDLRKYLMYDAYVLVDEINEIRIDKYRELYTSIGHKNNFKKRLKAILDAFKNRLIKCSFNK